MLPGGLVEHQEYFIELLTVGVEGPLRSLSQSNLQNEVCLFLHATSDRELTTTTPPSNKAAYLYLGQF